MNRRLAAAWLLLGALAVPGLLALDRHELRFTVNAEHRGARFEPLRDIVPAEERLGFISDVSSATEAGSGLLYEAQYALAPRVVEGGTAPKRVVAFVADESHLEGVRGSLRVARRFPQGVFLLERAR